MMILGTDATSADGLARMPMRCQKSAENYASHEPKQKIYLVGGFDSDHIPQSIIADSHGLPDWLSAITSAIAGYDKPTQKRLDAMIYLA